jgi:hypothetical protein
LNPRQNLWKCTKTDESRHLQIHEEHYV